MNIPITDDQVKVPDAQNLFQLVEESPELKYLKYKRAKLGGYLPMRSPAKVSTLVQLPSHDLYATFDGGSKGREISTTMAFSAILRNMMKSGGDFGKRTSLMVTDESRTF